MYRILVDYMKQLNELKILILKTNFKENFLFEFEYLIRKCERFYSPNLFEKDSSKKKIISIEETLLVFKGDIVTPFD